MEPSTAPLRQVGETYVFSGNVNNTIEVQRSNVVLDGNGFTVTKPSVNTEGLMIPIGWLPGVRVAGISNVTVTDFVFDGCITGVTIENASNVVVSNNTIRRCSMGIVVFSSSKISIVGNNITFLARQFIFCPAALKQPAQTGSELKTTAS